MALAVAAAAKKVKKTHQQKKHAKRLTYPLITSNHRAYLQRTVSVSEAFWEGEVPKPTDTYHLCITEKHDPTHTFERVRNVHGMGVRVLDHM